MAKYLFYDDMLINVLRVKEKPSGGAAVQSYAWAMGLKNAGQEIAILTNIDGSESLKPEALSFEINPLYKPNFGIRWIRWIYYRFPYLLKTVKRIKPDYLIIGIPHWSNAIIGLICKLLEVKFIIRVSCDHLIDERFYQFHSRIHKLMMNVGFSFSYAIICQNDYQYKILHASYPKKKVIKFGNPFFNKFVKKIEKYNNRKYFAWVGLFQYQKNMKLLYQIALKLNGYKFKIAGKENFAEIDEETKLYIGKLKNLNNVEFVGYLTRDELIQFLSTAKFLLSTSHYEGFSNTFLEAMFCGTPVITTPKANPDNIINKFSLGYVYSDIDQLSMFISKLNEEEYSVLSLNALDYVSKNHDYMNLANKLIRNLEN